MVSSPLRFVLWSESFSRELRSLDLPFRAWFSVHGALKAVPCKAYSCTHGIDFTPIVDSLWRNAVAMNALEKIFCSNDAILHWIQMINIIVTGNLSLFAILVNNLIGLIPDYHGSSFLALFIVWLLLNEDNLTLIHAAPWAKFCHAQCTLWVGGTRDAPCKIVFKGLPLKI